MNEINVLLTIIRGTQELRKCLWYVQSFPPSRSTTSTCVVAHTQERTLDPALSLFY